MGMRVLIADDDTYSSALLSGVMRSSGYDVDYADSVAAAIQAAQRDDFHVVVTDLWFGEGPTGLDLIRVLQRDQPWLGFVLLTSHRSVAMVGQRGPAALPKEAIHLVKGDIGSITDVMRAIDMSLSGAPEGAVLPGAECVPAGRTQEVKTVTGSQADVLRMMAMGYSTAKMAHERGTTVRAIEKMIRRVYVSLGVEDEQADPKALALQLWLSGRISTNSAA